MKRRVGFFGKSEPADRLSLPPRSRGFSGWARRTCANMLLLAVAIAFSTIVMELVLRLTRPQPLSCPTCVAIYRHHPRLPFFALQPNARAFVDTGESQWDVATDENGFRVATSPASGNTLPIAIVLGDSFTFGQGVRFEDTFVARLDGDPGRRFHFVNAGVPAYGPSEYAAVLDDLLRSGTRPRLVVVATFLGNDFFDTVWEKDLPVVDGVLVSGLDRGPKAMLKRHSHLYRLAANAYHRLGGGRRGQEEFYLLSNPETWRSGILASAKRKYQDAMERIADRCRELGLDLVFVMLPTTDMIDDVRRLGLPGRDDVADSRLALVYAHRVLDPLSPSVLDTTPDFACHQTASVYYRYDGHLTPLGHRLVADLVLRKVPGLRAVSTGHGPGVPPRGRQRS